MKRSRRFTTEDTETGEERVPETGTRLLRSYPFVVDLLGRLGVAVRYEDLSFQEHLVDGVRVRLATPATLYRMKKDTIRPIDRADAQALRQRFDLRDD